MKYFLIAGEASGDLHAGRLIAAIRQADPQAQFRFLGGDCMSQAAGTEPVIHYKRMAYMAFSEVLRHLPDIARNMRTAKKELSDFAPDAVILVDYPSFNLKIAEFARRRQIPVYYYISPKVWAWKKWRVKTIVRNVRKVFSILPFETEFYARYGYPVDYVGNPTANEIAAAVAAMPAKGDFLEANKLPPDRPLIAVLPGSRLGEIRNNLPLMARAASRFPSHRFVVAGAPNVDRGFYRQTLLNAGLPDSAPIIHDTTYPLLRYADAALVTSGTATLEAAVIGTPQIVCYRANGSKLSYRLFKRILSVDFVSLPNLIAAREVVPELLLHLCTADRIAQELRSLLTDPERRKAMTDGYAEVARRLGATDSAATAARQLINDLTSK